MENSSSEHFNALEIAYKAKGWLKLTEQQIEDLIIICELNGVKEDVFDNLLKNAPHGSNYGQEVWNRINLLEKQNFIWVERTLNNSVVHFHFHPDLKEELRKSLPDLFVSVTQSSKPDTFKFTLRKETHRIINNRPEYSGIFKPQKTITLLAGQEYSYGGWTNDDGGIFIKILPVERNIMTDLESERNEQELSDSDNHEVKNPD